MSNPVDVKRDADSPRSPSQATSSAVDNLSATSLPEAPEKQQGADEPGSPKDSASSQEVKKEAEELASAVAGDVSEARGNDNAEVNPGKEDEEEEQEEEEEGESEEEEEEDDEEEEERGSRRKRRKIPNFVDVEASVDDEEEDSADEEDLIGEDGFVQEAGPEEEGVGRVHGQIDRTEDRRKFTDEDAQKIAEELQQRHRDASANKLRNVSGSSAVPQQLLLPSVEDPPIFGINCRIGREKEAVKAILRKQLSLQYSAHPITVYSAFQRDAFPGRIYIEAASEAAAVLAVTGMPNVFAQSKVLKVPIREYPDMFRVVKKQETELLPGKYVRVKRGKYAGDLAIVLDLSSNGLEARLKLVPRLDYGRTTNVNGSEKRKRSDRPPQRLFSIEEAGAHDPRSLQAHGANSWNYLGEDYVKGYLNKDFKLAMIEADDVAPTLSEIAKFQDGAEDGDIDLASLGDELRRTAAQSTAFSEGERVEVTQGEQTGLQGRVVSVNGSSDIVNVRGDKDPYNNLEVAIPASYLRKHFAVGDHVRVVRGNYKDDTGLVVSTEAGQVTLLSDASQAEVTVFARDLRAASDTTVQNQLAGFAIQDLVQVNAQTVGCVVDVERDTVRVLAQDGQVLKLKPESIAMKLRAGGQRTATDARGREVTIGDTVRETSGEERQGTIIHIYHQYVFLNNKEHADNLGVFVNRISQVATVSTKAAREHGLDLSKMNPAAQTSAPVTQAPKVAHFNTRKIVGQKVSIGPGSGYKGLKGIVRDASETSARIELEAKNKVVTIDVHKLLFTSPASKQLVSLRDFMNPYGRSGPDGPGFRGSAGSATPRTGWNGGGRTPAWASGGKTPAWASGGKTPAWNSGGKTPSWNPGGKTPSGARTPAWNSGSKTPAWNAGGKTPAWNASGGKTPAWNADSGRTPAWSSNAGTKTPAWLANSADTWEAKTPGGFFSVQTPGAPTPGVAPTPGPTDWQSNEDDDDGEVKYDDDE